MMETLASPRAVMKARLKKAADMLILPLVETKVSLPEA